MSKTFDFQGGAKNIRLSDIDSTADTVVSAGEPVDKLDVQRLKHRPSRLSHDDGRRNRMATIEAVAGVVACVVAVVGLAIAVF